MALKVDWRLYVVLDMGVVGTRDPLPIADAALRNGATVLQLRAKSWTAREQVALAQALLPITERYGVPLLINNHADIALAVGAAGVHLGVDDLPVALARQIMPRGLIGYSPEGVADAQRAVAHGADNLGVGPFAPTHTKPDAGAAIGAAGLAAIVSAVPVPVVAIGGITAANAADVLRTGAAGIVVASAVVAATDPAAAARRLRTVIDQTKEKKEIR